MIKKRLIGLLSHEKKYIYLNVLWQWLSLLCQIVCYADIAMIIGALIHISNGGSILGDEIKLIYLIPIPASILLRFILDQLKNDASFHASRDVKLLLRREIFEKLLRLGPSYKQSVNTAEMIQLSTEGVEQLETYFGKYLSQLFYSLLAPVTLFLVTVFIDVRSALLLLLFVPLIPLSIVLVQKIAKRLLSKYWDSYANLSDSFLEALQGLTTLKIFGADERKGRELSEESESFRKVTMKVLTMQLNSTSVMDIMAYGGAAAGMISALSSYFSGSLSFTGALFIILTSAEFFLPMRRLGSYFHIAMNGMAASDRIFSLLDLPEDEAGDEIFPVGKCEIKANGLSFSYDERKALDSVNISLKPGEVTAIVGESGCGKSTFAGILSGELRGYEGEVLINNIPLDKIERKDLSKRVFICDSNPYIFKGTVRENLLMVNNKAGDSELNEILKKVYLYDDINERNGLDTLLLEEGKNLSGGQRQRLSMARALLSHASVFIFDEAVSSVDPETEKILLERIYELKEKDKTVLLISHRLSNVTAANNIYYLENGKVLEEGDHASLLLAQGMYEKVFKKQYEIENYSKDIDLEKKEEEDEGNDCIEPSAPGEEEEKINDAPRRNPLAILLSLLILLKPLIPVMLLSVLLGTAGFICAIFLPIKASDILLLSQESFSVKGALILVLMAVLRGILHYGEQYGNHYIAFKLLAIIRNRVFSALRRLSPAKLLGKDKGDILSLLTNDIELLEVFYAHTVSPILIAFIMGIVMVIYIGRINILAGLIALISYIFIGVFLPVHFSKKTQDKGAIYRKKYSEMNAFMLITLRGLREILRFDAGLKMEDLMEEKGEDLSDIRQEISFSEGMISGSANLLIGLFSLVMLSLGIILNHASLLSAEDALRITIAMLSSFGPFVALSNLSVSLNQTLASAERVLLLLREKSVCREIRKGENIDFNAEEMKEVDFSYPSDPKKLILSKYDLSVSKGEILGLEGRSGSGKSTVFRLLLRFFDPTSGRVLMSGHDLRRINTASLRKNAVLLTQETDIFKGTIAENIAIGKENAKIEEIEEATKKAGLFDFVSRLKDGFDTEIGELGETLSAGERQRLSLARAFLRDCPLLLLDEPTSNLDALNEGIILKSLKEEKKERTIIISSHRRTSLNISDRIEKVW